jgi:hypothetical protein
MEKDPLLEQAQGGNADALNEVFRREWRPIFGLAYAALHDRWRGRAPIAASRTLPGPL